MPHVSHRPYAFPRRPGSGLSPSAIVPNMTRRISRLGLPCTAPAKGGRCLRIVASTLSHCAFLRALVYGMRWSVRCRRWKPVIRRRSLRRTLWSAAKCSTPRVHATRPYSSVSLTSAFSMQTFRGNGAVSVPRSSSLNQPKHASPREPDPLFDLCHYVGGLVDKPASRVRKLYYCPSTSMLLACCFDDERLR